MKRFIFLFTMAGLLSTLPGVAQQAYKTRFVVAKDGSGDFTTIQAAVDASKAFPDVTITIFIKKGVYNEKIRVGSWNTHMSLTGESRDSTIITYGDFFKKVDRGPNSTFLTATLSVEANDFEAKNLTIENSAGAVGQALALSVTGTRCLFENCRLLGNQDTLYAAGEGAYQYYKNCYIEGTVDFIFGEATAVFEDCTVHAKSNGFITAASTPQHSTFGYVFINCTLEASPSVNRAMLGRPWRQYARTVYIRCRMGNFIAPDGWAKWAGPATGDPLAFYAEYRSAGEGADPSKRVSWSRQLTDAEAKAYTPENIFKGAVEWPAKKSN